MAKSALLLVCRECGVTHRKWSGRCDACGAWNSIEEDPGLSAAGPASKTLGRAKGRAVQLSPLSGSEAPPPRRSSGIAEFDRVLGGGLVPGSAILVGGDPGIGKSTLLLQAAAAFASAGARTIYVSGEEAPAQIRMRAARLGLAEAPVLLAAETNLRDILTTLDAERPALVVIDSIQTMWADHVDSAPGSPASPSAATSRWSWSAMSPRRARSPAPA
jgi:DNA repair protein RadA/Sms